jgi:hypothetical protein
MWMGDSPPGRPGPSKCRGRVTISPHFSRPPYEAKFRSAATRRRFPSPQPGAVNPKALTSQRAKKRERASALRNLNPRRPHKLLGGRGTRMNHSLRRFHIATPMRQPKKHAIPPLPLGVISFARDAGGNDATRWKCPARGAADLQNRRATVAFLLRHKEISAECQVGKSTRRHGPWRVDAGTLRCYK